MPIMTPMSVRTCFKRFGLLALSVLSLHAHSIEWNLIEEKAKGQRVYFHAWGGNPETVTYIDSVKKTLKKKYQIDLIHVKVTDIANTSTRLLAEKTIGKDMGGTVDIMWINGENFKSLKDNKLLYGPFTSDLPNWPLVDKSLPVERDFLIPTEGFEAPWGIAQLHFIYDKEKIAKPPSNFAKLLDFAQKHPNRVTYPRPPEFHGSSFLKSALIELTDNSPLLAKPVDGTSFDLVTHPLWRYLDKLHQVAWRKGQLFPGSSNEMIQLLDDGQIDFAMSFNPNTIYQQQTKGQLEPTTAAFTFDIGALTNVHFLAIPWNSAAKEGALVTINYLLSPEAQNEKNKLSVWGDPSILSPEHLPQTVKHPTKLFKTLEEIHPSWQLAIETEWLRRYGH